MANISATLSKTEGPGIAYTWADVTENDTPVAQLVDAGTYMISVEGDFSGGLSIEIKGAVENANHKSIPNRPDSATTLTFDAQTDPPEIMTFGRMYILPVVSSGSSAGVTIYLRPVPGGLVR